MGSARRGSNPLAVASHQTPLQRKSFAARLPAEAPCARARMMASASVAPGHARAPGALHKCLPHRHIVLPHQEPPRFSLLPKKSRDSVTEWPRSWTRNPLGSARMGFESPRCRCHAGTAARASSCGGTLCPCLGDAFASAGPRPCGGHGAVQKCPPAAT